MKSKKLKQYTLMVARTFHCNHPRKGEDTNFKDLILEDIKEHTCRENYALWRARAQEINKGKAVLVLKQWSGRPYYSTPVEFMRLTYINVQPLFMTYDYTCEASINGEYLNVDDIAINDGLEYMDFVHWFFPGKKDEWSGCVIHFKPQKYKCGILVSIGGIN